MPEQIPVVEAERAVQFTCGHCGEINYESYNLESDWIDGAACNSDVIACSHCENDNKVVDRF